MHENLILELSTLIETIPGPGPWSDRHDEALILGLADLPDQAYDPLRREVLLRFRKRPSVAELRELAASLLPAPSYRPPRLEDPGAAPTDRVPEHVRRTFEGLRLRTGSSAPAATTPQHHERIECDWGVEHVYDGGRVDRIPARHSRAEAQRRADEANAKYRHVTARIYQRTAVDVSHGLAVAASSAALGEQAGVKR